MENIELQNIWQSYDQKMERVLAINKELAIYHTKQKLNKQISRLYRPKWTAILIGVPYTLLLSVITGIAFMAKAYFVFLGFGAISLIMITVLSLYFYQLYLIHQVQTNEDIITTQQQLSRLKISSFKCLNVAIFQFPFWSICWMSIDAFKESPFVYGGINMLIFVLFTFVAYWFYRKMSYKNKKSKVRDFFLSGSEWDPILKSTEILEQIKEYEK